MIPVTLRYLKPTYFLDYNDAIVQQFAEDNCSPSASKTDKAVQLYYAVRDKIHYDPYDLQKAPETLRASSVVKKGSGYCVAKAVLLAAAARQQKIQSRLGFADVTNHLSTKKLRKIMASNLFIYHGYTELLLEDRWVKATPAFNLSLCLKFKVQPLEFDGAKDSLFHEYNTLGQKHMEYIRDHGNFDDLPFDHIFREYEKKYPGMLDHFSRLTHKNFSKEAAEENR